MCSLSLISLIEISIRVVFLFLFFFFLALSNFWDSASFWTHFSVHLYFSLTSLISNLRRYLCCHFGYLEIYFLVITLFHFSPYRFFFLPGRLPVSSVFSLTRFDHLQRWSNMVFVVVVNFFFFFFCHSGCVISAPRRPEIEPRPQRWKCWILTTKLPGDPQIQWTDPFDQCNDQLYFVVSDFLIFGPGYFYHCLVFEYFLITLDWELFPSAKITRYPLTIFM